MSEKYVAAIDYGSSKIVGVVAKKSDNAIEIIDIEEEETLNKSLYKGIINSKDDAAMQINRILKKLSNGAGIKTITKCYLMWQGQDVNSERNELQGKIKSTLLITPKLSTPQLIAKQFATEEELENGCLAIDFGHSVTSFSYIENNKVLNEHNIPGGSYNITFDLMQLFDYSYKLAEKLKMKLGKAVIGNEPDKLIRLGGEKTIKLSELSVEIVKRVQDIFMRYVLGYMLKNRWNSNLDRGIIIGGGGANLAGMDKYLELKSGLKVKIAIPKNSETINGLTPEYEKPEYAAILSLVAYADTPCNEALSKKPNFLENLIKKGTQTASTMFDDSNESFEKKEPKK